MRQRQKTVTQEKADTQISHQQHFRCHCSQVFINVFWKRKKTLSFLQIFEYQGARRCLGRSTFYTQHPITTEQTDSYLKSRNQTMCGLDDCCRKLPIFKAFIYIYSLKWIVYFRMLQLSCLPQLLMKVFLAPFPN